MKLFSKIMGNQGQMLDDDPSMAIAQKDLDHFEHSFKGALHTANGARYTDTFGACKYEKRPISIVCKGTGMDIIEETGISSNKKVEIRYVDITGVSWDHANSEGKIDTDTADAPSFVILSLANSIELEGELKLRFNVVANTHRDFKIPFPMYIGMFAGAVKPKPFQRKRPNLSALPSTKLPTLNDMRTEGMHANKGSYKPCGNNESRRIEIALQHIYEGYNTFQLMNIRGASTYSNQFRSDSQLLITDEAVILRPRGKIGGGAGDVEFRYEEIEDWDAVDNDANHLGDSGIDVKLKDGDTVYFGVEHIRDVKHTLEYHWNRFQAENGGSSKLGSTHGRPIVSVQTLSGETAPPSPPTGACEVVDQDGILVRPGGKMAARRASIATGQFSSGDSKVVPPENRDVKKHWHKVVLHQGWLLKQGGLGVGTNKSWIKRYFVLYQTCMGHFLMYYQDFTECPMYTTEKNHRNVVDIAKTTFIRPGSQKASSEAPAFSFDIVTIERDWTLCAETNENMQKWLQLLTRAVDEDVAILPDEALVFNVKPKVDPLKELPATDYSTTLKVSAHGISVCVPEKGGSVLDKKGSIPEREYYFWVYTDFYKWSLFSHDGKLALVLNVFADSSFSRRNEYVFRNKEAVRLSTCIEFFIEKFMSVCHMSCELVEGAFDEAAAAGKDDGDAADTVTRGMHQMNVNDVDDVPDLLGLDGDDEPVVDAFGDDPFGDEPRSKNVEPKSAASPADAFGDDPFGADTAPPKAPPAAASAEVDLFGGDPFGDDPFSDGFSGGAAKPQAPPTATVKTAPALTPAQNQNHKQLFQQVLATGKGLFYDDGTLQIQCLVEVRGSQCRATLKYTNNSPANITDMNVVLKDEASLLRFEVAAGPTSLSGLASANQVFMMECMKPVAPGPSLHVVYKDSLLGKHDNTVAVPIILTTFNEALPQSAENFMSRWQQLNGAGQEAVEVVNLSYPLVPSVIQQAMTGMLKFSQISNVPGSSDFVLYGAASLRTGATTPTGEKINVGCLIKIEINVQVNALRVTIRALHPAASTAMLSTVKTVLV